jgi:hypothetical protein
VCFSLVDDFGNFVHTSETFHKQIVAFVVYEYKVAILFRHGVDFADIDVRTAFKERTIIFVVVKDELVAYVKFHILSLKVLANCRDD